MNIPLVFVSGPYSGDTAMHVKSATDLCVKVAAVGGMPICPNMLGSDPRFLEAQNYEFWIAATKNALKKCDAIIFTENFSISSGAKGEEAFAVYSGIPCFYNISDLAEWISVGNF